MQRRVGQTRGPYATRNSARLTPDWLQIARKVDDLSRAWFGIVNGVTLPSSLVRRMAMWLPSRTTSNPSSPKARTTLRRGASFGNRVTA